jgi:hypothetical protein
MTVPPWATAAVCKALRKTLFVFCLIDYWIVYIVTALVSDKYQARGFTAMFSGILCIVGLTMFFCKLSLLQQSFAFM